MAKYFDGLPELARIISKQRVKKLNIIDHTLDPTSQTMLLYDGLQTGKITNETEALKTIYNGEENKISALRDLSKNTFKKLTNNVFFLEEKNISKAKRTQHLVAKNYALIKILKERDARTTYVKIAEYTLPKAIEIGFTDIAYLIAKILRKHYAYINLNKQKFYKYLDLCRSLEEELVIEGKTDEYYDLISFKVSLGKNDNSSQTLEYIENIIEQCKIYNDQYDSLRINFNSFQIRSYYHLLKKEYKECIEVNEQAVKFFESHPSGNTKVNYIFNNDKFEALLELKNFDRAAEVLRSNLTLVSETSFNWFKTQKMALSLAFFQKDYNLAYTICKEVTDNSNFQRFPTKTEEWKIYLAYIQILYRAGKINEDLVIDHPIKKVKWKSILKNLPIFSKDKRGLNISIIIAQLVLMVLENKTIYIMDRIEALSKYSSRYLRNNENIRSNSFLKMIAKLPEANFHPVRVERYVSKYKKILLTAPQSLSKEISSAEIIPYEDLWEIIMNHIAKKKGKSNYK